MSKLFVVRQSPRRGYIVSSSSVEMKRSSGVIYMRYKLYFQVNNNNDDDNNGNDDMTPTTYHEYHVKSDGDYPQEIHLNPPSRLPVSVRLGLQRELRSLRPEDELT